MEEEEQKNDQRGAPGGTSLRRTGAHEPCCSSHGVDMSCERYRRTHFVEVRPCCSADARLLEQEAAVAPEDATTAVAWSCWACREAQTHCPHDSDHLPLAEALARFFNHDNPGEKEASWFLDDALAIARYAGLGPWKVERLEPVNCDQAVSVNGLVCILREGGKDCLAYLEPVCRLPQEQAPAFGRGDEA